MNAIDKVYYYFIFYDFVVFSFDVLSFLFFLGATYRSLWLTIPQVKYYYTRILQIS